MGIRIHQTRIHGSEPKGSEVLDTILGLMEGTTRLIEYVVTQQPCQTARPAAYKHEPSDFPTITEEDSDAEGGAEHSGSQMLRATRPGHKLTSATRERTCRDGAGTSRDPVIGTRATTRIWIASPDTQCSEPDGGEASTTSAPLDGGPLDISHFCEVCGGGPWSRQGVTRHRTIKHRDAQNARNLDKILSNTIRPKKLWTRPEFERLYEHLGVLGSYSERVRAIPEILSQFPGRNAAALERAMYDPIYKAISEERSRNRTGEVSERQVRPEPPLTPGRGNTDERESAGRHRALFISELNRYAFEIEESASGPEDPRTHYAMALRSVARGDGEYDVEALYKTLLPLIAPKNRNKRSNRPSSHPERMSQGNGADIRGPSPRGGSSPPVRRQNRVTASGVTPNGSRVRNQRNPTQWQTRRAKFKAHQDLWRKNKTALWKYIRSGWPGKNQLNLQSAHTFWSSYFGKESIPDNEQIEQRAELTELWTPLGTEDVKPAIKHQRGKAPGPDRLDYHQVSRTWDIVIVSFLNAILLTGQIPEALTRCRTVLIPKKCDLIDPAECRPITMSSIFLRILNSVLAKRVVEAVELHPCQRGFIPTDGCNENITLLNWVMHSAIRNNSAQCLTLLDVRKAFDSVSHNSILRALKARGVSVEIIQYIENTMFRSVTRIENGTMSSDWFPMTSGVKQGDPLSPILFNLVIDELLVQLDKIGGYRPFKGDNDVKVHTLAFADDLVIVAETEGEMQAMIRMCEGFYAKRGMSLNGDKSVALVRITAPRCQTTALLDNHSLEVGNRKPRTVSKVADIFTYLGIQFNPNGKTGPNRTGLGDLLDKIREAPLRPEQRLFYLRSYAIPTLMHEAVLSRVTSNLLSTWDKAIKRFVKTVVHLSDWAIDGLIHLPVRRGGLGIPKLEYLIPRLTYNRTQRLRDSDHPLITEWLKTSECETLVSTCLRSLKVQTDRGAFDLSVKEGEEAYWRYRSLSTSDGAGTDEYGRVNGVGNNWLYMGSKVLRGRRFVRAVQLRFNAAPIGDNAARHLRGNARESGPTARCRFGCNAQETLCHALQYCSHTIGSRTVERHDALVKDIANYLRDHRGYEVRTEEQFRVRSDAGREVLKPDIVIHNQNRRELWILDVTCPWESRNSLELAAQDKVLKYERAIDTITDTYNSRIESVANKLVRSNVRVQGIVFGARGGIAQTTFYLLHTQLGVPIQTISLWTELTIFRSILVYSTFCRGDRRGRRGRRLATSSTGGNLLT